MFGPLGIWEIVFIVVLALLIFGPRRLPEIGRTVGRGLAEFRKVSNEFQRTVNAELSLEEEEQSKTARRPGRDRVRPEARSDARPDASRPDASRPALAAGEEQSSTSPTTPDGEAAPATPRGAADTVARGSSSTASSAAASGSEGSRSGGDPSPSTGSDDDGPDPAASTDSKIDTGTS